METSTNNSEPEKFYLATWYDEAGIPCMSHARDEKELIEKYGNNRGFKVRDLTPLVNKE